MFNSAILSGRLVSDAELKYTQNNVAVTSFTLAVERPFRKDSEKQVDFINLVAWRSTAEFISKYFKKGSLIGIEGSIQMRKYEDSGGNKRTFFEVVVNQAHFIESKHATESENQDVPPMEKKSDGNFEQITGDEDLPF